MQRSNAKHRRPKRGAKILLSTTAMADMGLLLCFMFIWNMLGALILIPSLAFFLLRPSVFRSAKPHLIQRSLTHA
jgi:hypothetical protein